MGANMLRRELIWPDLAPLVDAIADCTRSAVKHRGSFY